MSSDIQIIPIHELNAQNNMSKRGKPAPLVSDEVHEIIMTNKERLDGALKYERDLEYDYFGFKTLEKSYLLKMHGKIVERPQHVRGLLAAAG